MEDRLSYTYGGRAPRVPSPHLAVASVGRQSPSAAACGGDASPPRTCSLWDIAIALLKEGVLLGGLMQPEPLDL